MRRSSWSVVTRERSSVRSSSSCRARPFSAFSSSSAGNATLPSSLKVAAVSSGQVSSSLSARPSATALARTRLARPAASGLASASMSARAATLPRSVRCARSCSAASRWPASTAASTTGSSSSTVQGRGQDLAGTGLIEQPWPVLRRGRLAQQHAPRGRQHLAGPAEQLHAIQVGQRGGAQQHINAAHLPQQAKGLGGIGRGQHLVAPPELGGQRVATGLLRLHAQHPGLGRQRRPTDAGRGRLPRARRRAGRGRRQGGGGHGRGRTRPRGPREAAIIPS